MDYSLVVNGTGNAFLQEFGCPCPRCALKEPVANMSVSIIRRDEGRIAWHALVDVGLGVVNSLIKAFSPDEARLDWLLFSHWHPDHSLEVNRLGETMRRTARRRGVKFARIPTWCRGGTGKWLARNYSYEWYRCLEGRPSDESEPPGTLLAPIALGTDGIEITPLSVSHSGADIDPDNFKETRYSSACFIVRTARKKTVLLWDLDNKNGWITSPQTEMQKRTVEALSGADHLFIDCFSWTVEEVVGFNTGHLSFCHGEAVRQGPAAEGNTPGSHGRPRGRRRQPRLGLDRPAMGGGRFETLGGRWTAWDSTRTGHGGGIFHLRGSRAHAIRHPEYFAA